MSNWCARVSLHMSSDIATPISPPTGCGFHPAPYATHVLIVSSFSFKVILNNDNRSRSGVSPTRASVICRTIRVADPLWPARILFFFANGSAILMQIGESVRHKRSLLNLPRQIQLSRSGSKDHVAELRNGSQL